MTDPLKFNFKLKYPNWTSPGIKPMSNEDIDAEVEAKMKKEGYGDALEFLARFTPNRT